MTESSSEMKKKKNDDTDLGFVLMQALVDREFTFALRKKIQEAHG